MVIAVSAVRPHDRNTRSQRAANSRSSAAGPRATAAGAALASDSGATVRKAVSVRTLDRDLTAALARVLTQHTGDLAVGLIDRTTGLKAIYGG